MSCKKIAAAIFKLKKNFPKESDIVESFGLGYQEEVTIKKRT